MPVISNATVATGTGLSTAGNGGRKLVRLSNGNMYSVIKNGNNFVIYKSVNGGSTWSQHYTNGGNTSLQDVALSTKGNDLYLLWSYNNTTVVAFVFINESATPLATTLDSSQTALGNVSIAINEAGTELHAAWSSKNATYPNSYNIRYAKGTINGDGSVTWGAVEQITKANSSGVDYGAPSIVHNGIEPIITSVRGVAPQQALRVFKRTGLTSDSEMNWTSAIIFNGGSYVQSNPSAIFVSQSINGLANGRLWVAWHGKDATDSAKFNVRVSYSDDGGVTWATPTKLTSGNTYDRQNVTLGADKTGKVFALYEQHQYAPDTDIYMRVYNGSWGAESQITSDANPDAHPSSLVDYTLQMTTPPFVYTHTDGIKFNGNFNVGASVSPVSGALGNKETATLTAYTVTPEAGSTVTQIVERVNGTIVNTFNNPASLSRTLTVPTATWDTLAYFANHTASVTVTDSNGAQTVTTYSFDKRLATNASLLEATKANADAKNRISQKRDALAAQVGLSAGATFDAILGAFGSSVVKKQEGTVVSSNYNGSNYTAEVTFSGLSFLPKMIMIYNGRDIGFWFEGQTVENPTGDYRSHSTGITGKLVLTLGSGNSYYVNATGFFLPIFTNTSNRTYNYIVLG